MLLRRAMLAWLDWILLALRSVIKARAWAEAEILAPPPIAFIGNPTAEWIAGQVTEGFTNMSASTF